MATTTTPPRLARVRTRLDPPTLLERRHRRLRAALRGRRHPLSPAQVLQVLYGR